MALRTGLLLYELACVCGSMNWPVAPGTGLWLHELACVCGCRNWPVAAGTGLWLQELYDVAKSLLSQSLELKEEIMLLNQDAENFSLVLRKAENESRLA